MRFHVEFDFVARVVNLVGVGHHAQRERAEVGVEFPVVSAEDAFLDGCMENVVFKVLAFGAYVDVFHADGDTACAVDV